MRQGKRLSVHKYRKQKMHGWRDVLEKSDRGETQAAGGRSKEQERYGGRNTGQRKQDVGLRTAGKKDSLPLPGGKEQISRSEERRVGKECRL